jgi:alcohol dehydrogenase (cytochrome c)
VKDLTVAWTWSLNSGNAAVNEFTPLVHDGVLFVWNFGETIQALDAKTGTLLWQYAHQLPSDYPTLPGFFRTKRSLAIGGNKLIVPTTDMRVIALDVKIGTKLWDVVTDDDKSLRTYNSGPLVSKDKVLVGAGNCSPGHANRPGGRAWWRHLEQPAQREARRWRHLGAWRTTAECAYECPRRTRASAGRTPGTGPASPPSFSCRCR